MSTTKKVTIAFWIIVLGFLLYAAAYIYRTSFMVGGERYFVLFDDAMISMRFAKNLANGRGLVWNPGGPRIEGYTNPLWVLFMALFHLLPIPLSKTSLLVQISGAVLLGANLYFVGKIAAALSKSALAAVFAMLLTAFYTPLNNWGLQGMEVSALALIVSAGVWISLENLRLQRFTPWLYLLLGAATLIRLDAAVPYLVTLVFFVLADPAHRRRHLAWGTGLFLLFVGGQTLLRWLYYGDLLPNTYYLKMTGYPALFRIGRGLYVLLQYIWHFNWLLFLFPFLLFFFRRDRAVWLLWLLFIGQVAYSVYVGGDAWEHRGGSNRYFSIVMPLYFVLFAWTADLVFMSLASRLKPDGGWARRLAQVWAAVFLLGCMLQFNAVLGEVKDLERWLLLRQPAFVEGNKETVQIALDLRQITQPEARVAVVAAGALPYFAERPAIDLLGKVDRVIARQPAHASASLHGIKNFRPGHVKYDYDYSIGQLKPDVIAQIFGEEKDVARAYIDQYYTIGGAGGDLTYSLRTGSPRILWGLVVPYTPPP